MPLSILHVDLARGEKRERDRERGNCIHTAALLPPFTAPGERHAVEPEEALRSRTRLL